MASSAHHGIFRAGEQNNLRQLQNMFKKFRKNKAFLRKAVCEKKGGLTPLITACHRGHLNVVRYLVTVCGADIHQVSDWSAFYHDMQGASPLLCAVVSGHLRVVKFLIFAGADGNSTSHPKWTPIRAATYLGFGDIVQVLLDNGANLELATWHGYPHPVAKWTRRHRDIWNLIRVKMQEVGTNSYYFVCLIYRRSIRFEFSGVCYYFLLMGLIDILILEGNYELMRRYINYFLQNLVARARENDGKLWTSVYVALLQMIWVLQVHYILSKQNVEKLEKHYCDLLCLERKREIDSGLTMLHAVCHPENGLWSDRIAYMAHNLLALGANVNAQDCEGNTPLHMAATKRPFDAQLVDLLISHGAHIDMVNSDYKTPMDLQPTDEFSVSSLRYPLFYQTLQCLAARAVCRYNVPYDEKNVTRPCIAVIEQHSPKCYHYTN